MLIVRVKMKPDSAFIPAWVNPITGATEDNDAERPDNFYVQVEQMTLDFIVGTVVEPDGSPRLDRVPRTGKESPVKAVLQASAIERAVPQDVRLVFVLTPDGGFDHAGPLVDAVEKFWRKNQSKDWQS